jgi:predicted acylesterase/phospholipase RssA
MAVSAERLPERLRSLVPDDMRSRPLFEEQHLQESGGLLSTAGEIHVVLEGEVWVRCECPLRGLVTWRVDPGRCFGGGGADPDGAQAPELQLLQEHFQVAGEARLLVLPAHVARREPGLRDFIDYARAATVRRLNAAELTAVLRGQPGLAGQRSAALAAALERAALIVLSARFGAFEIPPGALGVALEGTLAVEGGEALPRFEVAAGPAKVYTDGRASLLVVEPPAAGDAPPASAERRVLESSAFWRHAPADLDLESLFTPVNFASGEVLSNTIGQGPAARDSALEGAIFVVVSGEVKLSSSRSAAPSARKRGAWFGGGGWIAGTGWRLPGVANPGLCAVAHGETRVLAARLSPELEDWKVDVIRQLVIGNLLLEAHRDRLRDALARVPQLRGVRPRTLRALVEEGEAIFLRRGARLRPPPGELVIPLQPHLTLAPAEGDARYIPPPEAFSALGVTEFFADQRPGVVWEALRGCWLFRLTRRSYQSLARRKNNRLPPLERTRIDFDRAGGAELVVFDSERADDLDRALPHLADLVAQAMVHSFADLVLVVRIGGPDAAGEPRVREGGTHQPDRVALAVPEGQTLARALEPHLHRWNEDYTFILLVPVTRRGIDREGLTQVAPFAERLVFLTRDPTATSQLPINLDCAVHYAVLLPDEAWPNWWPKARPTWAPDGRHPGFPDGAVRLRLALEGYRRARRLGELPGADRRRFERLARGLTDRRVGVALGGGGAYGYVHVALLMELERLGIPIDAVSGASVGATVGSVFTAAGAVGLQEFVRLGPTLKRAIGLNMISMRFMTGVVDTMLHHLAREAPRMLHPREGELENGHWPLLPARREAPLRGARQRLKDRLEWSPAALYQATLTRETPVWDHYRYLQDFELPFFPIATDLESGQEVAFEVGPVALGVSASGSFPLACPPSPHPQDPTRQLIDGGFSANVPDAVLARQGIGLVIVSNPIPPPSTRRRQAAAGLRQRLLSPSSWPLIQRGFHAYRASHILMHAVGDRDRRVVGASYQAPVSEFGITDLHRSLEIASQPFEQEEFHEALQEVQHAWTRLSTPRRPEGLTDRRREPEWADLARTGWAAVFPEGTTREAPIYQALEPLIEHRRAQVRTGGSASRFQVFLGPFGYKPGQTVEDFLAAADLGPGQQDPTRLGYHVLLVGGPEVIPFEFQLRLDLEYAVGRLSFEAPEHYAAYARRVLAHERGETTAARGVRLACTAPAGSPVRPKLTDQVLPAIEGYLSERAPGWSVRTVAWDGGPAEALAAQTWGAGEQASVLLVAGPTALPRELPEDADLESYGWPRLGEEPLPLEVILGGGAAPEILVLLGGCSAGVDDHTRYGFLSTPPPIAYPDRPLVNGFARRLLRWERGPLVIVGELDVSWFLPPLTGRQSEAMSLAEVMEMLLSGRTAGASMQSTSDHYFRKLHLRAKAERLGVELQPRQVEGLKLAIENARSWLLLGDPAVRLG